MHTLRDGITALLEVIVAPERAFRRSLNWVVPFLVIAAALAFLEQLQAPMQGRWYQHRMEAAGVPADQITAQAAFAVRSPAVTVPVTALVLLLRWLVVTLALWLPAQLLAVMPGFRGVFTIVAYSWLPLLARDAVVYAVLRLRGEEALAHFNGLHVGLGLDLLFRSLPPWAMVLARNLNLFEAWFVALLAAGLCARVNVRWTRALAVVLPGWTAITIAQAAVATLTAGLQSALSSQ